MGRTMVHKFRPRNILRSQPILRTDIINYDEYSHWEDDDSGGPGGTITPTPNAIPVNTLAAAIAATIRVGDVVIPTAGSWTGYPTPVITHEWYVNSVLVGSGATYTVLIGDLGNSIYYKEIATNSEGVVSQNSNTVASILAALADPVNIMAPVISGDTAIPTTLTATTGTWTGEPTPTITGQWQRDGVDISGETDLTYLTNDPDDDGAAITYLENANGNGADVTQVSNTINTAVVTSESHRYWRIQCLTMNNSTYVGFGEIEMRLSSGGADQTTVGQAIEGGHWSGNVAGDAFDNDANDFWNIKLSEGTSLTWIGQDFGSAIAIAEMRLTARINASNYDQTPDTFNIQWSDDASSWTTILAVDRGSDSWSSGLGVNYIIQNDP